MRLGGLTTGILVFALGYGLEKGPDPLASLVFPKDPVTRTEDGTPVKFLSPDEYDSWQAKAGLRARVEGHFWGQCSGILKCAGAVVTFCSLVLPGITPKKY